MLINLKYNELNIDKTFCNKIHEARSKENYSLAMAIHNDDINVINSLLLVSKPKIIVETGTNIGLSTLVLAYHDFVEKVITYDLSPNDDIGRLIDYNDVGIAFRNTIYEKKIEKRLQRTDELNEFPVADFYFFDSAHVYNVISKEYSLAEAAIKNNNKSPIYFVFHDYRDDLFDVKAFIEYLSKNIKQNIFCINTERGLAYLSIKR